MSVLRDRSRWASRERTIPGNSGDAERGFALALAIDARFGDHAAMTLRATVLCLGLLAAGGCAPCGGMVSFADHGYCFQARSCCTSADCGSGSRCSADGRCTPSSPMCGCDNDSACPSGDICLSNDAVCGGCFHAPPRCPTGTCASPTDRCESGFCVADAECPPP